MLGMKLLDLKNTIVYGPVKSRRLGPSLGINLFFGQKVCSFDCIYCQYGRTRDHTLHPESSNLASVYDVQNALRQGMKEHPESRYVTFSGNGEPTIHPDFDELVDVVIELRNELLPEALTAALSNGTALQFPKVLSAVSKLDVPIIKLDAGNSELWQLVNRPCEGATFYKMLDGARSLAKLKTQTVFFDGPLQNHRGKDLEDWIDVIRDLRPLEAQIYSIERPVPDRKLKVLTPERLEEIAEKASNEAGVKVNAYFYR